MFGTLDDEFLLEKRKMAIFANLNSHISAVDQSTPTEFGTWVEPDGLHFHTKARWDRVNHSRATDVKVHGKCANIGTPGEFNAT